MRPVRTCWSAAARGAVVLLALVCALTGAASAQAATNIFTTIGITTEETRDNAQIRGPYAFKAEDMPPSRTVGPAPDDTVDDVPVRMPDTTGNVANLAEYRGQTLDLREELHKPYTRINFFGTTADGSGGGDFTLRFDDGSTEVVPDVDWPDWCQSGNAQAHIAIGPGSGRWRPGGEDGAPCSIFHRSAAISASGKTLVAITLPPDTDGNAGDERAYLMAMTLESADGSFDPLDLSGALSFPNDKTAPVSEVTFDPAAPDGNDGWYKSPVLVTINAEDDEAGVEQTLWRLSGGVQRSYLAPFLLTEAGEHTFEYRAIDAAGNAEGFKSVPIKVDPEAPATTATVSPDEPFGTGGWHDGAVTLRLTANDDQGSGVVGTEYRVDGGAWTAYAGSVVVEQAGEHVVEYRSSDVAGNVAEPTALPVKVDKTPPVTTARINGAAPVLTYAGAARIALTRDDGDGSGAVATEYRIGADGAWTPYTGAFDLAALGGHRVDFRSRDLVGNTENFRTLLLWIDPAPIASGTHAADRGAGAGPVRGARARRAADGHQAGPATGRVPRPGLVPGRGAGDAAAARLQGRREAARLARQGARQAQRALRRRHPGGGDAAARQGGQARPQARRRPDRGVARPAHAGRRRHGARPHGGGAPWQLS